MKIKYRVIVCSEGRTDFHDCWTPEEVISHADLHRRTDAKLAEIAAMELGDEATLDGCSDCYALKP